MMMSRWIFIPLCWATATAAWAQAPDASASPACRQALGALQAEEASVLSSRGSGSAAAPSATDTAVATARLQPWRDSAARACLGAGSTYSPPTRTVREPVTVPPVTLGPPVKMPPPPTAPTPPAAPTRTEPLTTILGCDAAGCWASDGTRLTRNGSTFTGPRGTCTLQGAVLRCP